MSSPGVRMVMVSAVPFTLMPSGSSAASRSARAVASAGLPPAGTVSRKTRRLAVRPDNCPSLRSVSLLPARCRRLGLISGTGANVLVRAESPLAGLEAQQAQKPAVGTGDRGPPPPGRDHRPVQFAQAGPGRHGTARELSQGRGGSIKSRAAGDVVTFHDGLQVSGRADDQRRMDMVIAEEVPYLTDGGGQRMSDRSRDHRLGRGTRDLIHRSRISTAPVQRRPRLLQLWCPPEPRDGDR